MLDRLTDTLDFQAQALVLRSERQRLIASNIANADTPGYVARDMDFAQALRQATGTLESARTLAVSRPGHIGAATGAPASGCRWPAVLTAIWPTVGICPVAWRSAVAKSISLAT